MIDTVPGELWIGVCNILQVSVTKAILKKKKCKRVKWLFEKALQIAEERREAKGKGERERYTQANAEFQSSRILRRDKKAFLNKKCNEIKENNRMRMTRDLFKNIGDTKGIFHARMGMKKIETISTKQKQKILRRDGKNTQKNYTKKVLMTWITTIV